MSEPARQAVVERLRAQRVLPVLRLDSADATERAVDCLLQAGYRCIEITLTTPGAVASIGRLRARAGADLTIGAGTVLDAESAERCVQAGARFLVAPCRMPELVRIAHAAQCAALAGGLTPTEVHAAYADGADIVKVFPASTGGPEHLRALRAVYPHIPLCPTGGITLHDLAAYFAAGATLVGVGNHLIDAVALGRGDRAAVLARARAWLEAAGGR